MWIRQQTLKIKWLLILRNTELNAETHQYQVSESSLLSHTQLHVWIYLCYWLFLVEMVTWVEQKKLTSCVLTENKNVHGSSKDRSGEMAAI